MCEHERHGDGSHDGHSHDVPIESGPADSLYSQVDVTHVVGLNVRGGGGEARKIVKWVSNFFGGVVRRDSSKGRG